MPSLATSYTFADFLLRLQRSPPSYMSLLYHQHGQLFRGRPDMFTKAVRSISWERSLALLKAAYHSQPIAVDTYDGVLRQMLLHNRHVCKSGAGEIVGWKPAMHVFSEAILAHGRIVPSHMWVLTLRLLAPHRKAAAVLKILQLAQANEKLTKSMLVDAAHVCASQSHWERALHLLMHLHKNDPTYLTRAIQSLRPVGGDAFTTQSLQHSILPNAFTPAPNAVHTHILSVLNEVVSNVPWGVALRNELCHSYLSHLAGSTVLTVEEKVRALSKAIQQLPWDVTMALLRKYTEPNLLLDAEWEKLSVVLPDPTLIKKTQAPGNDPASSARYPKRAKRKNGARKRKGMMQEKKLPDVNHTTNLGLRAEVQELVSVRPMVLDESLRANQAPNADDEKENLVVSPEQAWNFIAHQFCASKSIECPPSALAALIAVLISKLPSPEAAVQFVEAVNAFAQSSDVSESTSHVHNLSMAVHNSTVRLALLEKCCHSENGWRWATELLLSPGNTHNVTPTKLLSRIVLQLRGAKQVSLAVRLLCEHIVPTQGKLTQDALEALFECILAHNRAIHAVQLSVSKTASMPTASSRCDKAASQDLDRGSLAVKQGINSMDIEVVHWKSALSWATDLFAPPVENYIVESGTGTSHGAVSRRPAVFLPVEKPFSARMLSILLSLCVDACSPEGALYAMGYARRVGKVELAFSQEIRALLYCMMYDRPSEAEAIVAHGEEKHGKVRPYRSFAAASASCTVC